MFGGDSLVAGAGSRPGWMPSVAKRRSEEVEAFGNRLMERAAELPLDDEDGRGQLREWAADFLEIARTFASNAAAVSGLSPPWSNRATRTHEPSTAVHGRSSWVRSTLSRRSG
jgi:hypothetical protein